VVVEWCLVVVFGLREFGRRENGDGGGEGCTGGEGNGGKEKEK
jgi:hypothetical protein